MDELIERLLARVDPLRQQIAAVCRSGEGSCELRIVQYEAGPTGPAFVIEPERVAMLSELGAGIDIDQYFLSWWAAQK
jgi:hypothetical protein